MVCAGAMRNPMGLEHTKMDGKADWRAGLELVSAGPPVPSLDHSIGLRDRRMTAVEQGEVNWPLEAVWGLHIGWARDSKERPQLGEYCCPGVQTGFGSNITSMQ